MADLEVNTCRMHAYSSMCVPQEHNASTPVLLNAKHRFMEALQPSDGKPALHNKYKRLLRAVSSLLT